MSKETEYTIPNDAPKAGEIYKHYKGDLYRIVLIAEHSDPDELCVVYEAIYDNPDFPYFSRLFRHWYDVVEWEGEKVNRFTLVE